jgi:glycosyltransferase involved in cell wall biosynthesis
MTARLLLANQLRSIREISWTVVTGDAFDQAPEDVTVELVPIRRELAPSDLKTFTRLVGLFRRRRFDFVQTHTPKPSLLGLPAARLAGSTAIYTIHGALYFADNDRAGNIAGWAFEKWCCAWAHLVLVQSREDERVLPRAHICARRKVRYIGNGVVLQRLIEPVTPAPRESDQPVVLMVSRLVKEKGCSDFLQLAGELRHRARFVHVGPTENDQRDAISAEEISRASEYVTFVGAVDDIRPYLAAADIVVLPSYREGIPRVAMEAAAAGRPIVAYDVRGVREVIDAASGLLVPRGDEAALANVVSQLLDDPERRTKLGEACRDRVVEAFSEDAVIERLRGVYAELASNKAPPARRAS